MPALTAVPRLRTRIEFRPVSGCFCHPADASVGRFTTLQTFWEGRPEIFEGEEVRDINLLHDAKQAIEQRAADGDLRIWGKTGRAGTLELIPSNYWHLIHIELMSLYLDKPEDVKVEETVRSKKYRRYGTLKISRGEFERIWPPRPWWNNLCEKARRDNGKSRT